MMPGRRLVAVAALALLAPVGLAACQSDPAVAAYVGDTEISEERVTGVVSALRTSYQTELEDELAGLAERDFDEEQITDFRSQGRDEINRQLADARDRILLFLVLTEVSRAYVAGDGLEFPEPDRPGVAEQQDLPEDHPYVEVVADFNAVVGTVLQAQVSPGEPTEEDQREVYENIRVDGQPVDVPFEDVQQFLTADVLAIPIGIRDLMVTMLEEVEVRVQPGYELEYQVPVSIGGASSWLGVQISEASSVRSAD
jgi:hypothetical protein